MKRKHTGILAVLILSLTAAALAGCNDERAQAVRPALMVRTQVVQAKELPAISSATGEIQPRFRADLSFRTTGRVIERLVEVGDHVQQGRFWRVSIRPNRKPT